MEELGKLNTNSIRRMNLVAGTFHLLQCVAVLILANGFALPVTARYMSGPPGSTFGDVTSLFQVRTGVAVAVFLGLSALFHFLVVSPKLGKRYRAGLLQKHNYFRWVEYSFSS